MYQNRLACTSSFSSIHFSYPYGDLFIHLHALFIIPQSEQSKFSLINFDLARRQSQFVTMETFETQQLHQFLKEKGVVTWDTKFNMAEMSRALQITLTTSHTWCCICGTWSQSWIVDSTRSRRSKLIDSNMRRDFTYTTSSNILVGIKSENKFSSRWSTTTLESILRGCLYTKRTATTKLFLPKRDTGNLLSDDSRAVVHNGLVVSKLQQVVLRTFR
jgi:hypothetical protein